MGHRLTFVDCFYPIIPQPHYTAASLYRSAKPHAEVQIKQPSEEARAVLLRLGSKRLGEPDSRVQSHLNSFDQIETLDILIDHILDVESRGEHLSLT